MNTYDIRRLTLADLGEIAKLHRAIYGWAPDASVLERRYRTDRVGAPVVGYLAETRDTREVAAYYGVFPIRVILDGRVELAAQSGDTMTHPAHQGRGLFTALATRTYETAASEGVAFVFGFPNRNSYPGFVKKLGWTHAVNMRAHVLWAPTLPVGEVLAKLPWAAGIHRRLSTIVLRAMSHNAEPHPTHSSVGAGGVLRTRDFYEYKGAEIVWLRIADVSVCVKVTRCLDIGEISGLTPSNVRRVVRRLRLVAAGLGLIRVRFYCSPTHPASNLLERVAPSSESLPYGYRTFGAVDPSRCCFAYIDYDTY